MKWTFTYRDEKAIVPQCGQRLPEFLEEHLYILWELTPLWLDWYEDYIATGSFSVQYCGERSVVIVDRATHTVKVVDLFE